MGAVTTNRRQRGHFMAALASIAILGATAACGSDEPTAVANDTTTVASSQVSTSADPTSADPTTSAEPSSADPVTSDPAPTSSSAAPSTSVADPTSAPSSAPVAAGVYKDGSYSETGNYSSPGGTEQVKVDVTLAADVVTAVTVTPQSSNPTGQQFESQFASGIAAEVVGKNIDDLSVTTVSGSSLTSGGFNEAIEKIKADAQS